MSFLDRLFPPPQRSFLAKTPQEGFAQPPNIAIPDEPSLEDRLSDDPIRNGILADQLLKDPLLKQCFADIRSQYLRQFEAIKPGDVEGLKLAHLSLQALADVRRAIFAYRFNGQTALSKQNVDQRVSRPINSRSKQ